jgi:hypothetical protein
LFHGKFFSQLLSIFFIFILAMSMTGAVQAAPAFETHPSVIWNTFVGSPSLDIPNDMVLDANGNVYIIGSSHATWGSPLRAFGGVDDVFVAKFNSSGTLVWSTFLGSASGRDIGSGIALDGNGNIYVTGRSNASWGTPLNAMESATNKTDAFVAKLDSSGDIIWNTFIDVSGNDQDDAAFQVAVDTSGNSYITGYIGFYAFAFKLNSSGVLQWTTYLGDNNNSATGYDIALDGNQDVYVLGTSSSTWGNPLRSFSDVYDSFIVKLDPSDGAVIWNTFLGGNDYDGGASMALDQDGNIYVTGESDATWGSPIQAYTSSYSNAFVAKLNSSGALIWNTFLGGSDSDYGTGIDVDTSGNVYLSGVSTGTWGNPLRAYAYGGDAYADGGDGFAAKLNSSGMLVSNTFLGSNSNYALATDNAFGIGIDQDGYAYVIGGSGDTWGDPLLPYVGFIDAFVSKVDLNYAVVVSSLPANANPTNVTSVDFTVTFSEPVTGVTLDDFTLSTSDVSGAFISGVTGSAETYTVTVSTGSGSGTIRLNVVDNDTILSSYNRPLGGVGSGNGNFTIGEAYTIDRVAPSIVSSVRMNQNPSHAAKVDFIVTFTEPVMGAGPDDFILSTTGVSGAGVSSVLISGKVVTVTVTTGSGDGTIHMDINDDDSITDLASNPLGGVGNDNGDFTTAQTYTIKMKAILAAPTLRSPRTKAVLNDTQPTFQWTKIIGAKNYEIQFDDNNDFSSLDVNSSLAVPNTSHTVGSAFGDGEYFWRVRANNSSGDPGKWSTVRSFTIDTTAPAAPTLTSPSGLLTRRTQTFVWQPSVSAVLYEFVYDDDADCSSPLYSKTTNKTSIRPPAIAYTMYYWCVRARDSAGNWSSWPTSLLITLDW